MIAGMQLDGRKRSIGKRVKLELLAAVQHHRPAVLVGRNRNVLPVIEFGKAKVDLTRTVSSFTLNRRVDGVQLEVLQIATGGHDEQAENESVAEREPGDSRPGRIRKRAHDPGLPELPADQKRQEHDEAQDHERFLEVRQRVHEDVH